MRTQGVLQIDSAETPDFASRTFDYPRSPEIRAGWPCSGKGHVHNSNDRVDLGRDTVRVFDKNAEQSRIRFLRL